SPGAIKMADPLTDSNARLKRLLEQTLTETDPVKYNDLGAEISRELSERERLTSQLPPAKKPL
ncbi:MAG: hypothetical protein WB506_02155, partial [Candidatus Sulfotelmatobacter sp.]